MRLLSSRPTYLLSALWLFCLAVCAGVTWFVMAQTSLGLDFSNQDGQVHAHPDDATLDIHIPAHARGFQILGEAILADDLQRDLDAFETHADLHTFYVRQDMLLALMHQPEVRFSWAASDEGPGEIQLHPHLRPWHSLPASYWLQLAVASICVLISGWVCVLKPGDWATRLFLLTGLMLLLSGATSAVIFAKELAFSSSLLHTLIKLNHLGGYVFGCALIGLFLLYPEPLVRPRTLLWLPVFYGVWFAIELSERTAPLSGAFLQMLSQLLLCMACATLQWRRTRGLPLERAALRWFLLSIFVCCNLFVLTYVLPLLLGLPTLLPFEYAFALFLIMYVGIALGLGRYRLFDLDEWAYRVFLWVISATAVIGMDVLLVLMGLTQGPSLGISLAVCGWLYFPFRQWLWRRMVSRRPPGLDKLLPELSVIAFIASPHDQQARWRQVLQRLFEPVSIQPGPPGLGSAIRDDGLGMDVPASGPLPACTLRHAGHGTRLFSTRDAVYAASLSLLLQQIMSGRTSYEQGVAQERLRIGRDLHDNIGARLLKLVHQLRGTPNAEVARDAMKDLRTAIAAMDTRPVPLSHALADWRAEANGRCEAADCSLHWQQATDLPDAELPPRTKSTLESVMRELVTNALKHAAPSHVHIGVHAQGRMLHVEVANDGRFDNPLSWTSGYGLRNLRGRMDELGGHLRIAADTTHVRLTIEVPLT